MVAPTAFSTGIDTLRVLLIEDNVAAAAALRLVLDRSGMLTEWAATGAAAVKLVESFMPDVALVDLGLPDANGIDLVRWLAAHHRRCGIIIVTGSDVAAECAVGLELGADDYITKPPVGRELVARIRAVCRRLAARPKEAAEVAPVEAEYCHGLLLGRVKIDFERRRAVTTAGREIHITETEFAVLEILANPVGETVSRDTLCKLALHRPWQPEDRSIDQLIFMLRNKLMPAGEGQQFIRSVRHSGYRLVLP
jgi:DNA-binding response OmpR family regulator